MLRSIAFRTAILTFATALAAVAGPVEHTLTFFNYNGDPLAGISASFTYDADSPQFTNFLVDWHGLSIDLTAAANAPNLDGNVPCVSGLSGAAASFSLLSGACAQSGAYFVGYRSDPILQFSFYVPGPAFGDAFHFQRVGFDGPEGTFSETGTWTLGTPEPASALLLATGLMFAALVRRYRLRAVGVRAR